MEDTRQRILEAAHDVFATEGFRGATTRRIAREASVNEVTLFRHFEGKEDLLAAAIEHRHAEARARYQAMQLPSEPAAPRAELRTRLESMLRGFATANRAVRTALAEWGHHDRLDELLLRFPDDAHREVEDYLVAARDAGLLRRNVDPYVAARVLVAVVFADGLLRPMMPDRFHESPDAAIRSYLDVIFDGLLPPETEDS
ncbi:MAG: helix-turn-helix domain-containing protein [Dehalococcoidia bacterium]|nr:helix-turn-helix domain-containing protein [Dehalococcoidia bacterium]